MDICAIETCGKDAAEECEVCGKNFCKRHGNKEDKICFDCKIKEENSGEDVDLF